MNAEKKVIKHKFSVLELAETLGNSSSACRQKGVSRTQFYEYKRRFQDVPKHLDILGKLS